MPTKFVKILAGLIITVAIISVCFYAAVFVYKATHARPAPNPTPTSFVRLVDKVYIGELHSYECGGKSYLVLLIDPGTDGAGKSFAMTYEGFKGERLLLTKREAPGVYITACHKFVVAKTHNGVILKVYGQ